MAKARPTLPTDDQPVMLSDAEREVIARLRMTPEQRQAERAAREQALLSRLPADLRQTRETKMARVSSMTEDQRRVYYLGQHLVALARMIRNETNRGVTLASVLSDPDVGRDEAVAWFIRELNSGDQRGNS